MMGMDKMLQSLTGMSTDEMKQHTENALELLQSLNSRLESIERNCIEANARLKRLEAEAGITAPLQFIETDKAENSDNAEGQQAVN